MSSQPLANAFGDFLNQGTDVFSHGFSSLLQLLRRDETSPRNVSIFSPVGYCVEYAGRIAKVAVPS
jgi:hypothetical protein